MRNEKSHNIIRVDTHCDSLLTVEKLGISLAERSEERQLDFPRLVENGIKLQFFALFVGSIYKPHFALQRLLELLDIAHTQLEKYPAVKLIENVDDIKELVENEGCRIGALLSIEGGDAIESLSILRNLYRLGIRSMGLTWNNRNLLADGAGEVSANGGLTKLGIEVVNEMNRLGMLIDVSHLCEKSFWDVTENSSDPIIASHSNCYALCDHPRNLKDEQIKAIAKSGGVVSITFETDFLGDTDAESIIKHIGYVCDLVGTDFVGIGSDFDGLDHKPRGMEDVSSWSLLESRMIKAGFTREEIEKISGKNVIRVLKKVLKKR